jgi:hypothetical protein
MFTASITPPAADQPVWSSTLFGNAGYCRLWKLVAAVFLIAGIVGLLDHAWTISSDLEARRTWPSAQGEILSAEQRDDSKLSSKSGSLSNRTRYWVEYEVRFALPEEQCRSGIVYENPTGSVTCSGFVRTRSTQSTRQAFDWLLHGYSLNQPVTVLYDPNGPEIKIADQSIWLRYNFERLIGNVLWVIVFFSLYVFARGRLEYFKTHPQAETVPTGQDPTDKYKLTSLDLS